MILQNYRALQIFVKTADDQSQTVYGWLDVEVNFKNQNKQLNVFCVPSLEE